MNTDKKVQELLSKPYKMAYWDCYNDEPNSEAWMLEQAIENSLIVVEEMLNFLVNDLKWDVGSNAHIHFWQEVDN